MLRYDLAVKRPEGTVVQPRKDVRYVFLNVGRTKNQKTKNYTFKRVNIGRMIDEENMYPNDNYFLHFEDREIIEEVCPEFSNAIKIGANAVINKVMSDLGIDEIITNIYEDKSELIKDLIGYVIINESSVMQHYSDYAWEHSIKSDTISSDSTISRLLTKDMQYYDNQLFLSAWSKIQNDGNKIYLNYDSTNINTQATGVDLAEFGYAKDDDRLPQVNLAYASKVNDATPLFYENYPCSIIDNSQFRYMLDKANEFGYSNVDFILDRGYFSKGNLEYLKNMGCGYLMAIKQNSELVKPIIKEYSISLKSMHKNFIEGHKLTGITKHTKLFKGDKTKSYIHVYYDALKAADAQTEFMINIGKLEEELQNKIEKSNILKEEDLLRYRKYFKLKFDDNGYFSSYKRNNIKIEEDIIKYGFFVLVSSNELTATEALDIYRERDSIEKLFRNLKTGMGYSSFKVHSGEAIEAKTHLVFMANIVRNSIFQKLKKVKGNDRKHYTVPAALSQLEKIVALKNHNDKYIRAYGVSNRQKKILECFGIDNLYLNEMVISLNNKVVIQNKKS